MVKTNEVVELKPSSDVTINRHQSFITTRKIRKKKKKIPRNKNCPCGSRKKYKNCCGASKKKKKKPMDSDDDDDERHGHPVFCSYCFYIFICIYLCH